MPMKTPPPLRNYQQMVRIVRSGADSSGFTAVPYRLAQAYGSEAPSPVDVRLRSLDESGLNLRTSRQPEPAATDNYLPVRANSTLFHQLHAQDQSYLNGMAPPQTGSRRDSYPGTKSRGYLNSDALSESVIAAAPQPRTTHSESAHKAGNLQAEPTETSQPQPMAPVQSAHPAPKAGKQTRLPLVQEAPLNGIQGVGLDFSL